MRLQIFSASSIDVLCLEPTKVGLCFLGTLLLGVGRSTVWADINASQFLVDVWKPDEGVPHDSVTGFAQGTDGYLWMISDQALARFDGNRFVDAPAEKFAPLPVERDGSLLRYAGRLFDGSSGSFG
jgi:ligand-binding sensor domain-containing protein